MPALRGHLDLPVAGELCDPLCFRVAGWAEAGAATEDIAAVEAWVDGRCAGSTALRYERPDVAASFGLPRTARCGFTLVAHLESEPPAGPARVELRVRLRGGPPATVASRDVVFTSRDYRRGNFGVVLRADTIGIMRREHVYTTGGSLAEGSEEVVSLLRQYLPPAPSRLIDVGCGLGYYGRKLRADGYDWTGVELKEEDCRELARLGLPFRKVEGGPLPFADGEFAAALCIEVLEHIDDVRKFLAEIRRVAPGRLLVSVPNAELLPYLTDHLVTPRHMLDSDHRNFFTRWSLGSLLREFYPHAEVMLHTRHPIAATEGTPLFYHRFAVAWSP